MDTEIYDFGVHLGREPRIHNHKLARSFLHLLLRRRADMLRVGVREFLEYAFGVAPVALEGHDDGYFVPDVLEALAVIRRRFAEHLPVGHVDDPSSALVGVHPVANLHQGELEQPQVDYVPCVVADLNAVAHLKGLAPENKQPASNIDDGILERDR